MNPYARFLFAALLAGTAGAAPAAEPAGRPQSGADYRVGDKLAPAGAASAPAGAFKLTDWDALMPKGWDPMKGINALSLGMMRDGDPKAMQALNDLKRAWDNAPAEPSMDNARIRIAGFVVPLDAEGAALHEFLLVPYFGACIHTPPPPANQVIHVTLATAAKGVRMMDAIWVSGQMHIAISDTGMGTAGYRMEGVSVAPYQGRR
jgi:uncharacterized protein